jgi:hypothetical protein
MHGATAYFRSSWCSKYLGTGSLLEPYDIQFMSPTVIFLNSSPNYSTFFLLIDAHKYLTSTSIHPRDKGNSVGKLGASIIPCVREGIRSNTNTVKAKLKQQRFNFPFFKIYFSHITHMWANTADPQAYFLIASSKRGR